MRLKAFFPRKAASFFQPGIVSLVVVSGLLVILWARFDALDQGDRLLEKSPTVLERSVVNVDHFVEFWIYRVLHLTNDWAVIDPRRDFMNGNSVLPLGMFQRPVDWGNASVLGQGTVMQVDDLFAFVDKPRLDDLVVENRHSQVCVPASGRDIREILIVPGLDRRYPFFSSPFCEGWCPGRLGHDRNNSGQLIFFGFPKPLRDSNCQLPLAQNHDSFHPDSPFFVDSDGLFLLLLEG